MGTRSLTAFLKVGKEGGEFVTMYRQFDGYPEGHGVELAEFICSKENIDGILLEREYNGIGCLAAQVVTHFKADKTGIYLETPKTRGVGEEYIYEVYINHKDITTMTCYDVSKGKTVFLGTPEKFIQKYKKVKETA